MLYVIWAWTNGCANNRDAGGLRRHRAHYDVSEMINMILQSFEQNDEINVFLVKFPGSLYEGSTLHYAI